MGAHKIRQRELFDDKPLAAVPALQKELRNELLQLLTQWLYFLGQQMAPESRDE
jgi:hypothetical protein